MVRRAILRPGLLAGLFAAVLAASVAAQAPQAGIPLDQATIPQLEVAASQLAAAGRTAEALQLAEVLLLRDPKNPLAHFIVGQITFRAGNTETARQAARASFRNADTARQHYEAARLAAQVALADRRWFAAQYWARHTIQYAPDARHRAVAVEDFRHLRADNPWDGRLRFGIKPSDNVNGGADGRTNVIDGYDAVGWLSGDAMALRGVAATLNADVSYRLARDAASETRLGAVAYARAVELAGRPQMVPPYLPGTPAPDPVEIRNSEFSSAALGMMLVHARRLSADLTGRGQVEFGRSWQGGRPNYDYGQLRADLMRSLGRSTLLSFGASFERREWVDAPRDDFLRALNFGMSRGLAGGTLGFGLSASELDSSSAMARSWAVSGSVSYEPGWTFGPVHLSLGAGLATTVYPDYSIAGMRPAGGRQDDMAWAELGLWSPKIGYAAFTPELKLQALEVTSNVSRFTRSEVSVALGWRSAF